MTYLTDFAAPERSKDIMGQAFQRYYLNMMNTNPGFFDFNTHVMYRIHMQRLLAPPRRVDCEYCPACNLPFRMSNIEIHLEQGCFEKVQNPKRVKIIERRTRYSPRLREQRRKLRKRKCHHWSRSVPKKVASALRAKQKAAKKAAMKRASKTAPKAMKNEEKQIVY